MKQLKITYEDLVNHKYFNEIKALDNDDILIVKFSNNEEISFSLTKDIIFDSPVLYLFNKIYSNEELCYMLSNDQESDYFILAFNNSDYCISEQRISHKFYNI
jgi:competence transcription factor ComK